MQGHMRLFAHQRLMSGEDSDLLTKGGYLTLNGNVERVSKNVILYTVCLSVYLTRPFRSIYLSNLTITRSISASSSYAFVLNM